MLATFREWADWLWVNMVMYKRWCINNPIIECGIKSDPGILSLVFYESSQKVSDTLTLVGYDDDWAIAINNYNQVFAIDQQSHHYINFINSTPEAFSQCLQAYTTFLNAVDTDSSPSNQLCSVKQLEQAINEIDAVALQESNNWWSCIVQKVYEGKVHWYLLAWISIQIR